METTSKINETKKETLRLIFSAILLIATFIFIVTDGCIWAFGSTRLVQYAFNAVGIIGIIPALIYSSGLISED